MRLGQARTPPPQPGCADGWNGMAAGIHARAWRASERAEFIDNKGVQRWLSPIGGSQGLGHRPARE